MARRLNFTQAAERIGVSPRTLYRYRDNGAFNVPALCAGGLPLYTVADIDAWIKSRTYGGHGKQAGKNSTAGSERSGVRGTTGGSPSGN